MGNEEKWEGKLIPWDMDVDRGNGNDNEGVGGERGKE